MVGTPSLLIMLKSTPPAWAGTSPSLALISLIQLKSTPPAWAGTSVMNLRISSSVLKSTPPAWAGTLEAGRLEYPAIA